jgi:heptosyltransferase-3
LVLKLRHHGDVLVASPVFSVLKNHAPHLEIDALVYRDTAEMLSLHPAISSIHCVDRQWKEQGLGDQAAAEWRLLKDLRRRRYDLLVHLTPHPRGAWLKRLLGTPYAVTQAARGKGRFWRNSFTHFFLPPKANPRHMVELNLDALRRIGVYPEDAEKRLVLVPGNEADDSVAELLRKHGLEGGRFIHVHPTSRWLFKCWPVQRMSSLIGALQAQGHTIVVTAAPSSQEMAMVRDICASLRQPVVDLSGQLSLKQLAALSARARVFIGVDSAPMHIAAAMQTPTVALFGPSGDKEWGPWQVPHRVVASNHSCRPCGNDGCGGGKVSDCLTAVPVEQVLDAVQELLSA